MSRPRRLMILGAGVFQLAAIRRAVALGYHVITADYLPDNVGHRFSREYVNCSTVDFDAVRDHAERLEVDGIFSMASDVALPTVACVAEALGLVGPTPEAVRVLTRKDAFRAFQRTHGLDHPAFAGGTTFDAITPELARLSGRVLVKPADTSGSRGIAAVDTRDLGEVRRAFEAAAAHSATNTVCFEEFVDGEDVSAEGFLRNGEISVVCFTRKFTKGFSVSGHRVPGQLPLDRQDHARRVIERHFQLAGYQDGPFDADLRVTPERIVVLEMSPRLGGNGVPLISSISTGVDLVEMSLRLALGDLGAVQEASSVASPCGSLVLTSDKSGVLRSLARRQEVQAAVPKLLELELAVSPGDRVRAFRHGGDCIGYALFTCRSDEEHHSIAKDIHASLRMEIDAAG